jgi:hypothetical protein
MKRHVGMVAALAAFTLAACSDNTAGRLSLAVTSRPANAPPASSPLQSLGAPTVSTAGDSSVIAMGNDTIIVRSIELVLREIELKRVEVVECDSVPDNDDCEEFEVGPVLVSVPLGGVATETMVSILAPAGLYNRLEFEIHKPESSDDAAFIAAHPDFNGVSIRVTGTYSQAGTRSDFVYTSDLGAEQEVFIDPPLTVADGVATNVTLRVDIGSWFLNAGGTALVNPATANKGQPNESVVKDRIQASLDAFHDDDHDGHDDDNEHT